MSDDTQEIIDSAEYLMRVESARTIAMAAVRQERQLTDLRAKLEAAERAKDEVCDRAIKYMRKYEALREAINAIPVEDWVVRKEWDAVVALLQDQPEAEPADKGLYHCDACGEIIDLDLYEGDCPHKERHQPEEEPNYNVWGGRYKK